MARFKVNIEYIHICDNGDFKYPATCCVEDALSKEIRSGLSKQLYAEERDSINVNVKFIDYKHDND